MNLMTWSPLDAAIANVDGLTPDQIEQIKQLPELKIFTDAFQAEEKSFDGVMRKTLHCTASSTITDLHGDSMTQECVIDMAKQAQKGLTIYLNHKYSVPEDVFGKVYASHAGPSGEKDEDGNEIWDLHYDLVLTKNNDRVDRTYRMVKDDGIRLGVSIGAYILQYAFKDEEAGFWGGLIINRVLLVETSIVGIPANQRSWVQNGVISIGKHLGFAEKQIRRVLDGKEAAPLMKTASLDADLTVKIEAPAEAGEAEIDQDTDTVADGSTDNEETQPAEEAEVTAAAPETESTDEPSAEVEIDVTVGEEPEEASSDLEAVAPEIANSISGADAPAVELVMSALEHVAKDLRATRERYVTLEAENASLKVQVEQAKQDVRDAAEIIEIVARSPLGRKTQFAGPVNTFTRRFAGIYDEGFLKLIEPKE